MAPTTIIEPSLDIAVETPNSDPAFIPSITRDFVASRTGSNGVGAFVGRTADAVAVGDRDDGVVDNNGDDGDDDGHDGKDDDDQHDDKQIRR